MENPNDQFKNPAKGTENVRKIAAAVVAMAIIAGGSIYAWHRTVLEAVEQGLQLQILTLQDQVDKIQKEQANQSQRVIIPANQPQEDQIKQGSSDISSTSQGQLEQTDGLVPYKNDKYGYSIRYDSNLVDILLNDVFEMGTAGNPSFRIKSGGHFEFGVWENPKGLTVEEWVEERNYDANEGLMSAPKEVVMGNEKVYSSDNDAFDCIIKWIIIPKYERFYTMGAEICKGAEHQEKSLKIFQDVVSSFKFE